MQRLCRLTLFVSGMADWTKRSFPDIQTIYLPRQWQALVIIVIISAVLLFRVLVARQIDSRIRYRRARARARRSPSFSR